MGAELERARARDAHARARDEREEARDAALHAEHIRQLTEVLNRLEDEAIKTDRALNELGDKDSDAAQELRQALVRIVRKQAATTRELEMLERQRRGRDRDIEIIETRRRRIGDEQQEELRAAIEETERELHEQRERGDGEGEEIRVLERRLRALTERERAREPSRRRTARGRASDPTVSGYDEMVRTDDGRIEIMGERRITRDGPPEGGLESEVEELRKKVDGMHKQMEEMRRMLQQLLERDPRENETPPQETNAY